MVHNLRRRLAVAVASTLVAAAFVPTATAPAATAGPPDEGFGGTTVVRALDNTFRPRTVTIDRGASVRWVNRGDAIHTTTGSSWNAMLDPGESFTKRFRRAGTYRYSCTLHPGMTGRIIVS